MWFEKEFNVEFITTSYYINTNEIPGELLHENMIIIFTHENNMLFFAYEKITVAMAT